METTMKSNDNGRRFARWGKLAVASGAVAVACGIAFAAPASADDGYGGYDFGSGNTYSWGQGYDGGYGYGSSYGDGWGQPNGSSNWWASNDVVQNVLQGNSWAGAPSVQNSGYSPQQVSSWGNSLFSSWWR
ncbi:MULTISPECIES: hypothetical protein [Microbacterium]|uniref:Lactococcin 972 family bacteriocin n=1 Tax=Microbacterium sufflavum TaxID=2851649 RepID=A0ABY4IE16_9MICO|nr:MULTISPECIES: hypothetical protein [Microbacterium]UPL11012.1 hypothetical protein KV394_07760 [Microbacterium sufflavum]